MNDRVWAPRPARSGLRLWGRYLLQWLWLAPLLGLWEVFRYGFFLLALLAAVFGDSSDPDAPDRERTRFRRRLWLSRDRIRRERERDPAVVEERLWRRLTQDSTPPEAWIRHGNAAPEQVRPRPVAREMWVDASHYRQIGAGRALQLANAAGWTLRTGSERHLPRWLHLYREAPPQQGTHPREHMG